jgi:hypothetical protein
MNKTSIRPINCTLLYPTFPLQYDTVYLHIQALTDFLHYYYLKSK